MKKELFVMAAAAACLLGGKGYGIDGEGEAREVFPGDPLVITAIGEPARESEVPFGAEIITAEDFRLLAADNLAEGLVRTEGINVREYGGAGATKVVSMRGGLAKQTLVMVDGQPMNSHQGGDVDFNAVVLDDVERVEVIAGPSSALYGANATAGVVNVITRGAPEERRVTFRGHYGTYDEIGTAVTAGVPAGDFGVRGGGNYRRSDGFRENDDFEGRGGHVKLSYAFSEGTAASVRGQYQTSEIGVPGSLSYPSPSARQEDEYTGVNAGFEGALNDVLSGNAHLFYKRQKRRYADPAPPSPVDDTHRNDGLGGRVTTFYQLLEWNRVAVGGEYEREKTDSTAIGEWDGDTWAVFAQEDVRVGGLTTVVGARYDSSGIYGEAVSPRLGVRYRFNDAFSARVSAGRGFRAPTFDELFWPDQGFGGGNPDLKPEYCWTYEAGPAFNAGGRLKVELTYFLSDYDDLISGWPPENVDNARVQGLELGGEAVPVPAVPDFRVSWAGTYLASKDKTTGEDLDYRPEYSAFAELRYRYGFDDGKFALVPAVSATRVSRQQYTYYDPVTFEAKKAWLEPYALLNARLAFEFYRAEISVAAKNLTDEHYATVYDYPLPGRTVRGGFGVTF